MPEVPTYILAKPCVACGTVHELVVRVPDYEAWQAGGMVQTVFYDLLPWEREMFFISGICDPCWDRLFGDFDV